MLLLPCKNSITLHCGVAARSRSINVKINAADLYQSDNSKLSFRKNVDAALSMFAEDSMGSVGPINIKTKKIIKKHKIVTRILILTTSGRCDWQIAGDLVSLEMTATSLFTEPDNFDPSPTNTRMMLWFTFHISEFPSSWSQNLMTQLEDERFYHQISILFCGLIISDESKPEMGNHFYWSKQKHFSIWWTAESRE